MHFFIIFICVLFLYFCIYKHTYVLGKFIFIFIINIFQDFYMSQNISIIFSTSMFAYLNMLISFTLFSAQKIPVPSSPFCIPQFTMSSKHLLELIMNIILHFYLLFKILYLICITYLFILFNIFVA